MVLLPLPPLGRRRERTSSSSSSSIYPSSVSAARAALTELGYIEEDEEELVLSRRLPRGGKGRSTINGRLCPVSALAAVGDALLEVHGQNSHQALLKQSTHTGYLDRFAAASH